MRTEEFYRRAVLAPVVLPLIGFLGAIVLTTLPLAQTEAMQLVASAGMALAFIGAWSVVPYSLFLIGLFLWWRRPRSLGSLRRAMWLAPVLIAVPFGAVLAWPDLARAKWAFALQMVLLYGGSALVVGYAYVALIELCAVAGRRLGWLAQDQAVTHHGT